MDIDQILFIGSFFRDIFTSYHAYQVFPILFINFLIVYHVFA